MAALSFVPAMNKYPLWKNLLVAIVVIAGLIYSMPNLFGDDPSLQISPGRGTSLDSAVVERVNTLLGQNNLSAKAVERSDGMVLVRFNETESQLKAYDLVREALGNSYAVALNLAPATPQWLRSLHALPMYLGLDLRGGVHFLMEVDMQAAVQQALDRYVSDIRTTLRDEKVRYLTVSRTPTTVEVRFRDAAERDKAEQLVRKQFRDLKISTEDRGSEAVLVGTVGEKEMRDLQKSALQQNITTLRNRVNELGVAEPVIQQQGEDRIVVQLPGVQDTVRAKEIIGATATLEYHMVDQTGDVQAAVNGHIPFGSKLYYERNGQPILLDRDIIITGDQINDASSGLDQQSGSPAVFVTLDSKGARRMAETTRENIGKPMAVVFIESKTETRMVNGVPQKSTNRTEEVISVAVIRDQFSKRFQTTGLDSPDEARNLALLLRAGALAAPMQIVEERTVGPSLGADNIAKGFNSNIYGFVAIAIFMVVYYRLFGLFSIVALGVNVVLLIAVLSMLQATLTLPGMAGIALTVGMAIDANVLINERIREELRAGISPRTAIQAGYERAFGTILDSNITTFIAGFALLLLGSGPVRGFAVVLCIGILTSMFSAVMVSRVLANFIYGRQQRVAKLSI